MKSSKPSVAGSKIDRRSTSKGRSKAEQRAESQEQILDAAEKLFSLYGLYGVTIKDVAAEVGVHTSLLHYYFENKQNRILSSTSVVGKVGGITERLPARLTMRRHGEPKR